VAEKKKKLEAKSKGKVGAKKKTGKKYETLTTGINLENPTKLTNKKITGRGYADVGNWGFSDVGEDTRPYYGKIGSPARTWDAGAGKGKKSEASLKKKTKPKSASKKSSKPKKK
jgi:hypothetical protein